jgi:hypothetical protein
VRNYDGIKPITYNQYSLSLPLESGHTLRLGIDGFISPKQTIGFLFTGAYHDNDGTFASKAEVSKTGQMMIDSITISNSRFASKFSSQMFNMNYRLTISEGEDFTVDADYGRVYVRSWQNINSSFYDDNGKEYRLPSEFQYNGPRHIDIFSFKADYVNSFSEKIRMEAGIKTGKTITDNEIVYENRRDNGIWENDKGQSNQFKYSEAVSAGYATISYLAGKFSAMAGLRAEYTHIRGESPTLDTSFVRGYLGWFPSAYFQYQIDSKQGLNLSYSRKINRPGYFYLNPFREYIDPFTYGSGNPNLQPEYRNTVTFRYNIGGFLLNASYGVVNDVFEKEFLQDDTNQITQISYGNLGKREDFTLSGFAPIQIARWYTLRIYTQAVWNIVDAYYNGVHLTKSYLDSYVSLQHGWTLLPTMRVNMQMIWASPSWQGLIARMEKVWWIDTQIEKSFFDRRLYLSLSCNDLFNSMIYKGIIDFGNINQTFREHHRSRQVMFSLRYSFGSQQIRGSRNRSVGIEEEMRRVK